MKIIKTEIMKNFIYTVLALLLFVACKDAAVRYASSSPEIDSLKSLVKDYEAGDWEAWMAHYADTAKVYHNSKEASTVAELQEGLSGLLANTSSYGFEDNDQFYEMIVDDDGETWVNFWGNWEGTLSANNKKLSVPVHLTAQFVDGKIVEEHAYYDLSEYMHEINKINEAKMAEEAAMEETE